jgi:hypothetical protein
MSFLKLSTDGTNGSGKTCTMAQLAVGVAKEYCGSGAVHVFDSNDRWPSWKVHLFDKEKVPLVITAGDSIAALKQSLDRFRQDKGAVYVSDDLTVPWSSGLKAFSYENGNLPFDRRAQLMNQWDGFVKPFQNGEFHAIACGRLGYHWEKLEDPETGERELVQGDSKFNAGGGQNFGYDCNLECEMRRRKRRIAGIFRGKTVMEYVCDVVKDADSVISNEQFVWEGKNFAKDYKVGQYKAVLDHFRPHLEFRIALTQARRPAVSDKQLIVSGKTDWAREQTDRKGLLEELDALLSMCFPGGEKRSKLDTMFRNLTLEFLNGYISWSRMEDEAETNDIERNVLILRNMRKRIVERKEIPTDHNSLAGLLHLATEDVLHPGHDMTLLEIMTAKSMPRNKGPQPVVGIMDRAADEIGAD